MIPKIFGRPASLWYLRSNWRPKLWKVPAQIPLAALPTLAATRCFNSRAALLVNVKTQTWWAATTPSGNHATRKRHKHRGLATTCPRKDQQRTMIMHHGLGLFRIQSLNPAHDYALVVDQCFHFIFENNFHTVRECCTHKPKPNLGWSTLSLFW